MGGVTDPELHGDGPCGLCGRDPAAGRASVAVMVDGEWEETWYCHDDPDPAKTSCYEDAPSHRRGRGLEVRRTSIFLDGTLEDYLAEVHDQTCCLREE